MDILNTIILHSDFPYMIGMNNIKNILSIDNILKYLKRGSIKSVNAGTSAPNPSNNSEKVSADTLGALYKAAASKQA